MALTGQRRRAFSAVGLTASLALVLASCADTENIDGGGNSEEDGGGGSISVGTTDVVTSLDPAGSYDNGSFSVQNQVYPFLLNTPYGSPDVEPDIAESAEFTGPTEYTVTLKEGLTFANGNELTSSDVKFSFDRQLEIADPNGPSSLLYNLDSVEAPDDLTVVFTLNSEDDQTFPQILSSPVGPIVDEEVFSATELSSSEDIVEGNAFAGQYTITDYTENELIRYQAFEDYDGLLEPAETDVVTAQYFTEETQLKLAVQQGDIDLAFRNLSPTDLGDLREDENVTVHDGPGGEIRYIVFDFNTQPFGAETEDADEAQALAVRQAAANLLDREALSEEIYQGTYTPLYSYVPEGLTGAVEPLLEMYGDGEGGPDAEAAASVLEDAGVETPVELNLQYSPDHYGNSSDEEYAMIESQLEADGLFEVNLQSTLWDTYNAERVEGVYPAYQLGWFPDYSDADNYLSPFFQEDNFLVNGYSNTEVQDTILEQTSTADEAERTALIEEAQELVAEDLSTLPYLQGAQVAVSGNDINGVTLDASFKFRYAPLSR
ncbi:peptide ABC transporter substrate-binding protein [Nesterenkonia sp. E16_7]|uniref:ABC transporter substrate-binding protein n=1 Tax=unclassified Nesterenkonia TaxID=2629769 RepID=UPI001A92A914|nr:MULTISPECIES: ABC transporter substrate-binding protein [unclassified Nesterenkonia]MBO0596510.1 peptide ABC transporter substrate-binding protein [Nesterenkonia sp. E16_10]MBO0597856.1 peptide ABC transporter substrate-binding protein [Nesterenkonia sp. E16_7]